MVEATASQGFLVVEIETRVEEIMHWKPKIYTCGYSEFWGFFFFFLRINTVILLNQNFVTYYKKRYVLRINTIASDTGKRDKINIFNLLLPKSLITWTQPARQQPSELRKLITTAKSPSTSVTLVSIFKVKTMAPFRVLSLGL